MTDLRLHALRLWARRLERRSRLGPEDHATILNLPGRLDEYGSGRDIVRLDQRTTESCLVAAGCAAQFGQTRDGTRQLSAFYIPGDMGDLHSAVLPRVSAPLQAGTFAIIYSVPHEVLLEVAEQSPALARAFWRDCVVDAQVASEWMLNIGRRNATARVAHLLGELACRYAASGWTRDEFPVELTQPHLGDATGLTAIHVNRVLRGLREAGAIDVQRRAARVIDWDRLAAIGGFDPHYLHLADVED